MPKNLLKKPKKEEAESEKELKDDLKPPKKKKVKEGKRFSFAFLKDEKLIRVVGLFLSLFSIFLLFSFISFFYNLYFEWGSDELFNFDVCRSKRFQFPEDRHLSVPDDTENIIRNIPGRRLAGNMGRLPLQIAVRVFLRFEGHCVI